MIEVDTVVGPRERKPRMILRARETRRFGIKYAVFDGTHWSLHTVGPGEYPSLAVKAGEPAIGYQTPGSPSAVMLAQSVGWQGLSWGIQTVAEVADTPSVAYTPLGETAISYHDAFYAAIKYAVYNNGWSYFWVERAGKDQTGALLGDFYAPSLALNPVTGLPAIAYYDDAQAAIRCAVGTQTLARWLPPR
jgi:hypothetical protein